MSDNRLEQARSDPKNASNVDLAADKANILAPQLDRPAPKRRPATSKRTK